MSNCVHIKVRNKPNYTICDRYIVTVERPAPVAGTFTAGIEWTTCEGIIDVETVFADSSIEICVRKNTIPTKIFGTATVTIEKVGPCTNEDSTIIEDDLYLDLYPKFDLRETKQLTELTEIDTLRFDFTLGFDIPATDHNYDILKTFFNPNVLDNEYNEIEVEVITGSHVITESELYVKKCSKDVISVELRLSVDHWARKAKDVNLCDLPYAEVTINCNHLHEVIKNQYIYQLGSNFNDPNNLGIWYPAADYGRVINERNRNSLSALDSSNTRVIPIEMWRPWFYVTGILERGFCKLGWVFKSPLFESEFGRKLVTYIIDSNYGIEGGDSINRINNLRVRADVNQNYSLSTPGLLKYNSSRYTAIKFPDISIDPVSSLDPTTGVYNNGGEVNYKGKIRFRSSSGKRADVELLVMKIGSQNAVGSTSFSYSSEDVYDSAEFLSIENDIQEWEFDVTTISTTRIEDLVLMMRARHTDNDDQATLPGITILEDSFLEITGIRAYYVPEETESLQNQIDCSYTFLDFIKGLAHTFNLKIKTDFATRCVEFYQPFDADFHGEDLEGFYIEETIENIDFKINHKSKQVTTPAIETARYQEIAFKDSTDKCIDELNLDSDLWSKTIDLGEKFTLEETQSSKNPFFEPLYNTNGSITSATDFHIPKMSDGTEFGWNYGPRIAIAHGNVLQDLDSIYVPKLKYCTHEDDRTLLIPTVSQYVPIKLGEIHDDNTSLLSIPQENLVYEVNPEISQYDAIDSLYVLVYKRWMLEQLNNLSIQYLVELTNKDFVELDFRDYYCFTHLGRLVTARIQKVTDYHYCSQIETPVDFIPQRQLSDACDLLPSNNGNTADPVTPTECRNNPVLLCNIDSCYMFTLGGSNNAPIDNVVFEYRLSGSLIWNTLPNITQTSAQLCNQIDDFYIRATVTYDPIDINTTCAAIQLPEKLIQPCPDYNLSIECINALIVNGLSTVPGIRPSVTLPDNLVVTILSSTVDIDNLGPISYPVNINSSNNLTGTPLILGTSFQFSITVQIGQCTPVILTKTCIINDIPNEPNCDEIEMSLICSQDSPGCFVFQKVGVLPFEYDDYIKYRCSSDGLTWGPWKIWDEETPICCSYVEGKWFAQFCGDVCPFACSPVVSCGACTPFQVGTAPLIALCNDGNI